MRRVLLLSFMFLMVVMNVSAYGFGSFAYESEKEGSLNTTFEMGLINTGNETLEVNFESSGLEKSEIVLPPSKELNPSEISENPQGTGWISLENGNYAKVKKIKFWVLKGESVDQEDFTVNIEARLKDSVEKDSIKQRVVQTRNYNYLVSYPSDLSESLNRDLGSEGSEDTSVEKRDEKSAEERNESGEDETLYFEDSQNSTVNLTRKKKEVSENKNNINNLTYILGFGALASVIYLWRVI